MSLSQEHHHHIDGETDDTESLRAALAAKDEILAVVAHELRSPLGAILGWAHMLRQHGSGEEFERGLDVIEQSVQVQSKLIDDLLDMSRMTSGTLRLDMQRLEVACQVNAAVESVLPAARMKGVAIRKALDDSCLPLLGDPTRLQQVLCNLLTNAVKFTPAGGYIEVSLRQQGSNAVITVSDSGIGIAPELLPHVFERFRQGAAGPAQGGLGLGLAIARNLVELHRGELRAESEGEGRGASFTLKLPLDAAAPGHS